MDWVKGFWWALPAIFLSCRLAYKASGEPFWPEWVRELVFKARVWFVVITTLAGRRM